MNINDNPLTVIEENARQMVQFKFCPAGASAECPQRREANTYPDPRDEEICFGCWLRWFLFK